uniref:Na+/H+ exchanger AnNHA1 n=1 Tax=Kwoniella pini CBS 10737 TaxID=1296096 RepID=A0A1B9I8B7_9TREE|nr:Na+/H+ exchanger AnNHA1 [Kwoniella pini CBS 10737]OCF51775.1 Na+/H+ exchanger AnNHA1 [Kwoniella pini CBS 10737]
MAFHPFEVSAAHLAYTLLGAFVVIFGMLSLFIKEKLYLGEAPLATVIGIIIGPHCLGWFNPAGWGGGHGEVVDEITLEVTRVVIAISVFAVGVELPKAYMKRHWRSLFFLLGPCMVYGWMVSALLMWALIPGINFLGALVIAAGTSPTDPILAQSVIGGRFADKHVPTHVRHLLSAESGSNDGAAFPFLYIALYLMLDKSPGHAVGEWFYMTWAYEIILGSVIGVCLGFTARKFMKFAERKRLIDRQSYVAQYVSLAVLSMGMTTLLGSDDLLCAFATGCAFAWDGYFNKATEDAVFSNVIDLLFNCAAFIYIGAIIPFGEWNTPDVSLSRLQDSLLVLMMSQLRVWRLVVLAILILLVRRLPVIVALYKFIPDIKTFREAVFTGWFGPMGVGAIFISTLARTSIPEGHVDKDTVHVERVREVIGPITAFLVLSSIVTHGLSIPFFSLGRRVHSITYTRSRGLSMDPNADEPAWTTHARRILPGQQITINRDDDPEEGDLGVRRRDTLNDTYNGEKLGSQDSGGTSSSRTMPPGDDIEMQQAYKPSHHTHREETEEGEAAEADRRNSSDSGRSGRSHGSDEERGEEEAEGDREIRDKEGGSRTPPLAEYREGHHLIIERKKKGSEEVEVEVIRNHFAPDKPSEKDSFDHPHRLKTKEVDKLISMLPKSLEHATSHVRDQGQEAIDRLGLGLMGGISTPSVVDSQLPMDEGSPSQRAVDPEEEAVSETEDDDPTSRRTPYSKVPAINVHRGSGSGTKTKMKSIKDRLFGRKSNENDHSPSKTEEGLAPPNPSLLGPPSKYNISRPIPIVNEPERTDSSESRGIPLTRTLSASRSPAIRFAPDVENSSETAPTISNYGVNAPGFKRNPNLAMSRSASIQSNGEGPSVSFAEPEKKR